VLAVLVTGCGVSGAESASQRTATALVLDGRAWQQQKAQLDTAEHSLTAKCMNTAGFKFTVPPGSSSAPSDTTSVVDLDDRRAHGYGMYEAVSKRATTAVDTDGQAPDIPDIRGLSAADARRWQQALAGDQQSVRTLRLSNGVEVSAGSTGCTAQSRVAVYGSIEQYLQLLNEPQSIAADWANRVTSDQRYLDAVAKWAMCMKDKGYTYARPDDAVADLQQQYERSSPASVRPKEIATAVADGECATSTGLATVASEIKAGYAKKLSAQEERALLRDKEILDASTARAKSIMSAPA